MSDITDVLTRVEMLLTGVKPAQAEDQFRSLLTSMGLEELRVWEPDLRTTIAKFLPKRRRILDDLLGQLLAEPPVDTHRLEDVKADVEVIPMLDQLENDLRELGAYHIFQWSTFYRDYLSQFFDEFASLGVSMKTRDATEYIKELLARHTKETFLKGYNHVKRHDTFEHAVTKSVSGLQRFLDLPIEFYSARLSGDLKQDEAIGIRLLTSSMICGIIKGYSELKFEEVKGAALLSDHARSWGHVLTFLSSKHLTEVISLIPPGDFHDGVAMTVLPLSAVLDRLINEATIYSPLPALSQLVWPDRRLDVTLRPPPYSPEGRPVVIQCYLDPDLVSEELLAEAANREVAAVIAPLRPDLRASLATDQFSTIVVPVLEDATNVDSTSIRLSQVLENAIYRLRSPRVGSQPLAYNFAREFPLSNPFLTRYYHVYRTSVRELMRTFERRNGVRLWCSVRRSGKTTAGIDLGTTTGDSNVVSQTCDTTGQIAGGHLLYDAITMALSRGDQIANDFFMAAVTSCMQTGDTLDHRTVLVLDEYETLFGHLASAVQHDLRMRYTVVQPLLNQMVAFTRDNLLVFLGQQPTAHYILMDQNQLSAYVQQDPFPLFSHEHKKLDGEFSELLQKILSNRVRFDQSFADRVYTETAGHPYLTVNLMVELVDWLIKTRRPLNSLSLTGADVSAFGSRMFRRDNMSISAEYRFFRDAAIRQALSSNGKKQNPWLYAVYSIIRHISIDNPESFVCSRSDFGEIVSHLGLDEMGLTPDYILSTAQQANFLTYNSRAVAPKIRLLARLAAVASPEVNA
jgi:hypothetical protein